MFKSTNKKFQMKYQFNLHPLAEIRLQNFSMNVTTNILLIIMNSSSEHFEPKEYIVYNSTDGASFNNSVGGGCGGAAAATAPANITLTAVRSYDSFGIKNYSVNFQGITNTFFNTTNGTVLVTNITNGFYNLTINSTENGGYLSRVYYNVDISGQSFQANLSRALINVYANDSLTGQLLQDFTVKTNTTTHVVTNGYLLLDYTDGTVLNLNFSSTQYPTKDYNVVLNVMSNITFIANLSPTFQFYLRREADNTPFDVLGTNTTKLTIYCPNKNIVINFKNLTFNSTQQNATIDCQYTLMKMDVIYSDSSYFRTLVPEISQQNVK